MSLKQRIKYAIIKSQVEKRKKQNPFDYEYAEHYKIPEGESNHPNNSYYFSLHDLEGKSLLFRLANRGDRDEVWFVYHDCNTKTYYNRDMLANQDTKVEVECLETGKLWRFKFSGPLIEVGDAHGTQHTATFEGTFTASAPIFEFSRHMDSHPLARALSQEKWTKEFLGELQENFQVHYEQSGSVKGTLILDGQEIDIDLKGMRDRSFGKREWNYMDRHIWLTAMLETGEVMNVNMVRYPAVRNLQTGYWEDHGKHTCVDYATSMDDLPVIGHVPDQVTCHVTLMDGRKLTMECEKEVEVPFPFDNGDFTIYEGIGKITINGVKGRGIMEFGFNKDPQRWVK